MELVELREIVGLARTLSRRLHYDGPQTDDELHQWVKAVVGVDIPRVAVCFDHDPPFKFLADVYFERVGSALALANRGGAKTFIVAIIHYLNATYKPGCEGLQFGATEPQGMRCYRNIEDWCYERDKQTGRRGDNIRDWIQDKPKVSETIWRNGSRVEVVAGSEKAVSGPHPQKAGADEIDQMDPGVWNQSRGMAVSGEATGKLPDFMLELPDVKQSGGKLIPAQDIATSTRNSTKGLMQEILDEVALDIKEGNIPEYTVFSWCIFETAREVPNCRVVDPELRRARLVELGRDPEELCQCNRVKKGYWPQEDDEGKPIRRSLEDVCRGYVISSDNDTTPTDQLKRPVGSFFYSRGFKPYGDLVITFKRNTPGTWVLQHECREGKDENNYLQDWSLALYGIRDYKPHPQYGPIYMGVDWGSDNPHSVLWFQYLKTEVPAIDYEFNPIYLAADTYICFKEIYVATIDAQQLARRVVMIEDSYKKEYGRKWFVKGRFTDPAGKGERITFSRAGLKSTWPVITRNKQKMITTVQNLLTDDRFAVDAEQCPNFCEEAETWRKDPKTNEEVKRQRNHAMSAWRYGISNAEVLEGNDDPDRSPTGGGRTEREDEEQQDGKKVVSAVTTVEKVEGRKVGPLATTSDGKHPTDQFSMR